MTREILLCVVALAIGGCHIATQREIQEAQLKQWAADDDAYCKQQTVQPYDACRSTRGAYRQTMMMGAQADAQAMAAHAQAQQAQAAQAARTQCLLAGQCW